MAIEKTPQVGGIATNLGKRLHHVNIAHLNQTLTATAELGLSSRQRELISQAVEQIGQKLPADVAIPQHREELSTVLLHAAIIFTRYSDLQRAYEESDGQDEESLGYLKQVERMLSSTRPTDSFYGVPATRRSQIVDYSSVIVNATMSFAVGYWSGEANPFELLPAIRMASTKALEIVAETEQQAHAETSIETYLQSLSIDKMANKIRELLTQTPGISPDVLTSMLSSNLLSDQQLRNHLMELAYSSPRNQANYTLASGIDNMMTFLSIKGGFFGSERTATSAQIEDFIRKTIYTTILLALIKQQNVHTLESLQQTSIVRSDAIPPLETVMQIILPQESPSTHPLMQHAIENSYRIAVLFLQERDGNNDSSSGNGGPGRRGGGFRPGGGTPTGSGDRSGDLLQIGS